jgi:hypothetical protein
METKKIVILGAVLYLVSTVGSYLLFSHFGAHIIQAPVPTAQKDANGNVAFDNSLPKTEECPINGAMYSKQQRKWWEGHRPLGIMVENHVDARPQSGLSFSDVIYEAVAEGGITRFLNVFYCQDTDFVGPVRSARTYFLDFISEYGDYPLYTHVGGANCDAETGSGCANGGKADALGQIRDYGWSRYNDLDQFGVPCPVLCRYEDRLPNRATEHTMYSGTTKLWDFAKDQRKLTYVDADGERWDTDFTPYTFKDDTAKASRPSSQTIKFDFWNNYDDYGVKWQYDPTTNSYLRFNGGEPHIDFDTKKQLTAKDVIILFMTEAHAHDGYPGDQHMLYGTKGTGSALVFQDGKEIKAKWAKKDRTSRTILTDRASGKQIDFTRGKLWFEIVSPDTDIEVN